jgi:hypothetical protein
MVGWAKHPKSLCLLLAEWAGTPIFTSSLTGVSFYMNTTPMDHSTAERMCNLNGGHLATYEK